MVEKRPQTVLAQAIKYLIGKGVIINQDQVAKDTGFDKSAISNFKNSRQVMSENFINKFKDVYKLDLNDFKSDIEIPLQNGNQKPETKTDSGFSKDYVELLKEQLEFFKGLVKINSEQTGQRLELIHQQTSSILQVLTGSGQDTEKKISQASSSGSDISALEEVQRDISHKDSDEKKDR